MHKIEREKRVVETMIGIYCRRKHGTTGPKLCADCVELMAYAHKHLSLCRHGESKSSCRKCAVHCYSPRRREAIRAVMRFVGPRMILTHPVMALRHILAGN